MTFSALSQKSFSPVNLARYLNSSCSVVASAVDDAPPDECAFPGTHGWQGRETGNVLAALGNVTNVLRDFAKGERRVDAAEEALKFFVHYMGDLHQPLHSSGREKGGNGARVTWNGRVTSESPPFGTLGGTGAG